MRAEIVCRSDTVDSTRAIGQALGALLLPGDVVALSGDLGAGKTAFVQGAAVALGVKERVTSPSFVLMREYAGDLPVLHLDVYRLNNLQELIDLGFEEFLDPTRVVFVEWGDAVTPVLPESHLDVRLELDEGDARRIVFAGVGPAWSARIRDVERLTEPWRGAA
jgi:tRNA threonylcarbamoyladenosine biosynthesis protein TsaE